MEPIFLQASSAATPLYLPPSISVRSSEAGHHLLGRKDGNFLIHRERQDFYSLLTMFAFHPPIRFLKVEIMIDRATNRAFDIV